MTEGLSEVRDLSTDPTLELPGLVAAHEAPHIRDISAALGPAMMDSPPRAWALSATMRSLMVVDALLPILAQNSEVDSSRSTSLSAVFPVSEGPDTV